MPDSGQIQALDAAVVDTDLLWQVDHANRLQPYYADGFDSVVAALDALQPDNRAVILLGPNAAPDELANLASALSARSELQAVVVVTDGDTTLAKRATDAGAVAVLPSSTPPDGIIAELDRLLRARPVDPGDDEDQPVGDLGRVLLFTGAKAGEGATTVAVNIAAVLSGGGERVALVETDPNFGDLALMLKLEPPEAVSSEDHLDLSALQIAELVRVHPPTGLTVFLPPHVVGRHIGLPPAAVLRVARHAQRGADVVVIDASFEVAMASGLESAADEVLLAVEADLASLKNAVVARRRFGEQTPLAIVAGQAGTRRRHLFSSGNPPDRKSIEHAVRARVAAMIPALDNPDTFVESGIPAAVAEPSSEYAKAIRALCSDLAERFSAPT